MNQTSDGNIKIRELVKMDKTSLPPDGGEKYNRLIFAKSPYLLQHCENPVDWREWSNESFEKAREEDKPVFLSVGYATCHWCHVMEHESFEDNDVAEVLNRYFIAIKVDREERPDVDDQYMNFAQMALEGGAGWPLNVFLDHERKPFYVATYMPRYARGGNPGIIEILEQIADTWRNRREVVDSTCATALKNLHATAEPTPAPIPEQGVLADATGLLEKIYDKEYGGFGISPKFPRPLFLSYLLLAHKMSGSEKALEMVEHSLKAMRCGGIYDQLGLGFHRYAVDRQWLVPHFEKMLYDQGMLAITYLEAFQITGNSIYRGIAEEILDFVKREMTSPSGGFYSAIDADSEGSEGKFYVWTVDEVRSILGEEATNSICELYGLTDAGNFEGGNILHLRMTDDELTICKVPLPENATSELDKWRRQLLAARDKRIKPLRDEMILTSWNGLMLAALAKGFAITRNPVYLEMCTKCIEFVGRELTSPDGRLQHKHYAEVASVPGFLDDYSFLVWGLLELHGATLERQYLDLAEKLSRQTLKLFADELSYGLFDSGNDVDNLLIRKKSVLDGVIPSGNSVAAANFIRLGKIKSRESFVKEGEGILRALMGDLLAQPINHLYSVMALGRLRTPDVEITLVGIAGSPETEEMLSAVNRRYIPGLVLRLAEPDCAGENFKMMGGRTTAYVCAKGACRAPVSDCVSLDELLNQLLS